MLQKSCRQVTVSTIELAPPQILCKVLPLFPLLISNRAYSMCTFFFSALGQSHFHAKINLRQNATQNVGLLCEKVHIETFHHGQNKRTTYFCHIYFLNISRSSMHFTYNTIKYHYTSIQSTATQTRTERSTIQQLGWN